MIWFYCLTALVVILALHDWIFYIRYGWHILHNPWCVLAWEFAYVLLLVYLILED